MINTNWHEILSVELVDPTHSYEMFNKKINEVLDIHVPLRKITKKELHLQSKPWMTPDIAKSIKRRDLLLRKYINTNDTNRKDIFAPNILYQMDAIIRKSKKLHYQKYFTENVKDIRKTWSGIENIINFRTMSKGQPTSMIIENKLKTDPKKINSRML